MHAAKSCARSIESWSMSFLKQWNKIVEFAPTNKHHFTPSQDSCWIKLLLPLVVGAESTTTQRQSGQELVADVSMPRAGKQSYVVERRTCSWHPLRWTPKANFASCMIVLAGVWRWVLGLWSLKKAKNLCFAIVFVVQAGKLLWPKQFWAFVSWAYSGHCSLVPSSTSNKSSFSTKTL